MDREAAQQRNTAQTERTTTRSKGKSGRVHAASPAPWPQHTDSCNHNSDVRYSISPLHRREYR